jgi:hypothetical protein
MDGGQFAQASRTLDPPPSTAIAWCIVWGVIHAELAQGGWVVVQAAGLCVGKNR